MILSINIKYWDLLNAYDDGRRGVWARPYSMFESKVHFEKYPNAMQEYRVKIVEIHDILV